MTHFVFCHSFGFDTQFWERIAPYFSQEKCSFIDLGYFGNRVDNTYLCNQRVIGIGHSIGLSKLLSMYSNFDYLIGLNSFVNFLGSDQIERKKRQKELNALRLSFLKDPDSAIRNFYIRCDIEELIECTDFPNLNFDLILSEFEWLQKEYKLPEVPTLILSSNDDLVVPYTITSDNFSKQQYIKIDSIMNGGHALGFRKPLEVYRKIMSFLNDTTA
jgi:pimeloyl-[acyl-carrier protein] methyl ester esterase